MCKCLLQGLNYIIMAMIFLKTLTANCNIFHFTRFLVCWWLFLGVLFCAVVFYEKVKIFPHSDNLLQVTTLWSDMIEAHIHLLLTNQNLTEVLLIFSFHH